MAITINARGTSEIAFLVGKGGTTLTQAGNLSHATSLSFSTASTTRLAINNTGAVSFGGASGTSGQVLISGGSAASPTWTSAPALTGTNFTGTASGLSIGGSAASLSATLGIGSGGTGQTSAGAAINALLPSQSTFSGRFLQTDGTNVSWQTQGNWTVNTFSGTGAQTAFTLSAAPANKDAVIIFITGLYQQKNQFSLSGTTLTFTDAPISGTNNIEVTFGPIAGSGGGGGGASPLTTKGDIFTYSTVDARFPAGTNGQVLSANSAQASGLEWISAPAAPAGGTTGEIQYNNSGAVAGMANVEHHGGDIILINAVSEPSVPPTDSVKLFNRNVGGRNMLAMMGPSGLDTALQPILARNKIAFWNPIGNIAAVPSTFGTGAPTAIGTLTLRNVATTNILTRMKRVAYVSVATAGGLSGIWNPAAITQYTVGNGSGLGGFHFICRFGTSDAATVSNARMFVGMSSSTSAATNVDPATLLNSVGVAQLSGSANLQIVYGGSTAQTAIDLGVNFPANTLSVDAYDVAFFSSPANSTTIGYTVTRLNTAFVASGTLTGTAGTVVPAAATLLGPRMWRTNNATALAVSIDICSWYIETDF